MITNTKLNPIPYNLIPINVKPPRSRRGGFTLIEIMVALSVFTVVMTIALGSLLALIDANKKSQSIQTLMTNLNYVIDDISRNARTGTIYRCENPNNLNNLDSPKDCPSSKELFSFRSTDGDQILYRLNASSVEKSENGGNTFIPITSPEITIDVLDFYVSGSEINDSEQPRVVIVMQGTIAPNTELETAFNIQTSVTQRLLDFN